MSQDCLHCPAAMTTEVKNVLRPVALQRFLDLQGLGYLPTMCEGENGRYAVCYDPGERHRKLGGDSFMGHREPLVRRLLPSWLTG